MRAPALTRPRFGPLTAVRMRQASLPQVLYGALIASAAAYLIAFVGAAVFRLSYPFPLQVTEGAVLRQVERVVHGQPLYVAPTFEHVPLIYGPVYFYAAGLIALLTGPGYLAMRLVSLLASCGSLLLVGRFVLRETRSPGAAVIAAGLLAATYPLAETALDLGRVDALFVFLLLAGMDVAYAQVRDQGPPGRRAGWLGLAASGVLIGLAGLTKLPMGAAPVALAIGVYLGVTVRGRALAFVFGCLVTTGAVLVLLRWQSGPWPTWYMLNLPAQHAIEQKYLGRIWFNDLLPRLTLPLLLGPVFVLASALQGRGRTVLFYTLLVPCLIGLAWASRTNTGGSTNVLLPATAALALLLGLGLHAGLQQMANGTTRARVYSAYLIGVCLVQFGLFAYNPRLLVPYRSDQWADERLAARLGSLPGTLFAPDLDGYLRGSDKGEQPLLGAMGELTGGYGGQPSFEGLNWTATLRDDLAKRRFSYVAVWETECCLTKDILASGYRDLGPLFAADDEFWLLKTNRTPEVHLYAAPDA